MHFDMFVETRFKMLQLTTTLVENVYLLFKNKYDHLILCNSLVEISNIKKVSSVCGIRRKKYIIKNFFDPKPLFSRYVC